MTGSAWIFMGVVWVIILGAAGTALSKIVGQDK